jgi:NAD-dependent DNA ligase
MAAELDANGQPVIRAWNSKRVRDSRLDELIGVCRGVLADGELVVAEAMYVLEWLRRNPTVRETVLGNKLYDLLDRTLKDGRLDHEEEEAVIDMLLSLTGSMPAKGPDASGSTSLPLDVPPPSVRFADRAFCFTGKFEYGSRRECEATVIRLGGLVHDDPTGDTGYLVIGRIGSRDWAHSSMGRKIEHAISLRERGAHICIIEERHWAEAVRVRDKAL